MGRSEFENTLRQFLDQKPFQPFIIDQHEGGQFLVTHRQAIGLVGGDSALFFGPDEKDLQFIDCDNVKQIVAASPAGTV
jgi:hypothetical protein